MLIHGVDVATVRKAIRTFQDIAWSERPAGAPTVPAAILDGSSPEEVLKGFQRDHRAGTMRRYGLRIGNSRYPFMKLIFQELLIRDRFFFAVDTHDELDLKDTFPDYEQWLELKRWNHHLKDRIEQAWQAAGVPTFSAIVAQVERETPPGPACRDTAPEVLIVDDDLGIAQGVHAILSRHGYRTRQVHSGEAAIDAVRACRPALILSDLEMGGMSGLDLASALRGDPATAAIPFILATAASLSSTNFRVIDGFLVKPYDGDLLLKFVSRHLARPGTGEPGAKPPAKETP